MITLNTKASGQFKVYTEDELGNIVLISESENLITDGGLHQAVLKPWADLFTTVLIGDSNTAPTFTDTTMSNLQLFSSIVPTNPASYTIGEYSAVNGATTRLGRTFLVNNTSGADVTVRELGTANTFVPPSTYNLFSRTVNFTPFVIKNGKFVYVVYELKLLTGVSTTSYAFTVLTDGGAGYQIPVSNSIGIVNCPFATINAGGTTINDTYTAGHALYEPLLTQTYYLHKQTAASTSTNSTYFAAKRTAFEADIRIPANGSGVGAPTFAPWGGSGTSNPLLLESPIYQNDFRLARHIIVSPTGSTELIHGFLLTNNTNPLTLNQTGIHCMFNAPWTRPTDSFFKLYFEHKWSR